MILYTGMVAILVQLVYINIHFRVLISFHMKLGFKRPNSFWEKHVLILHSDWSLTKIKEWPWSLILVYFHLLILLDASTDTEIKSCNYFRKIIVVVACGRVGQRCWINFQCWGVLLIWIKVGQKPTALAVGVSCLDMFSLVYLNSFLSSSLEDGPI